MEVRGCSSHVESMVGLVEMARWCTSMYCTSTVYSEDFMEKQTQGLEKEIHGEFSN